MAFSDVLTDEFIHIVVNACSMARAEALKAGHSVVYRNTDGSYVAEYPGGKRFEVRFDPNLPRESHMVVLRALTSNAA